MIPERNFVACAVNTDNQRAYYELHNHQSCCLVFEKQNKYMVKILVMIFTQQTRYESREKQPQLSQLFVEFSGPLRDLFICFFWDLLGNAMLSFNVLEMKSKLPKNVTRHVKINSNNHKQKRHMSFPCFCGVKPW